MNEIAEAAAVLITPIIEKMGYEVVEINYKKQYGENNLNVFVYKKGGVTLSDCESITHALDECLDAKDITKGDAYNLNISSMGLDRPIVTLDDYRRNMETDIEIILKNPLDKKNSVHGVMVDYDDESVTIISKCKKTKYYKNNISIVRPYINFK